MDKIRDKYLESGADKAGELTVDYAAQELQNGGAQQTYDDAQARVQQSYDDARAEAQVCLVTIHAR